METTCNRCHQAIPSDGLYCPNCGLPQLVYSGDESAAPAQINAWADALDGGAVEWKPALRAILLLAVPAGLLFGGISVLWLPGLIWVAAAAAWAVTLYVRRQRAAKRPFWLTTGAGARMGLVTGLIAGWTAFAATGAWLYVERFLFNQGREMDNAWQAQVVNGTEIVRNSGLWQSLVAAGQNTQAAEASLKAQAAWELSSEGRVGMALGSLIVTVFMLVVFAVAGGALGAKLVGKQGTGRTEQGGV